jgi:hypothetical protein
MRLTARRLNRATLGRQLLLARESAPVVAAVRRLTALQAQEPASPYVALWNRLDGFDAAQLDVAFADQSLVRAPLMRITLHAAAATDYPTFRQALLTTLRAARLHDRRFTSTGLTIADADALIPHLTAFAARPRTRAELEALIAERLGRTPEPGVWWALRTVAPLIHAPTNAPWAFVSRTSYLAATVGLAGSDADSAVRELIRRYLAAFGPASRQDFAQYALLRQPTVRPAFEALAEGLTRYAGPGGEELFDVPGAPLPAEDTPAPPRLLAMWDNVLLAYADRDRVIPPAYRPLLIRRNGDVLPAILVDGYVCGVWRPRDGGIEALAFHALPADAWDALAAEARGLLGLLASRDPAVYGRYGHWWSSLPAADVRHLGT